MIEPDTREHHLREGAKYVQHDMIRAEHHLIQQDIMQTLRQIRKERGATPRQIQCATANR